MCCIRRDVASSAAAGYSRTCRGKFRNGCVRRSAAVGAAPRPAFARAGRSAACGIHHESSTRQRLAADHANESRCWSSGRSLEQERSRPGGERLCDKKTDVPPLHLCDSAAFWGSTGSLPEERTPLSTESRSLTARLRLGSRGREDGTRLTRQNVASRKVLRKLRRPSRVTQGTLARRSANVARSHQPTSKAASPREPICGSRGLTAR
jgi:hypothetical protein